MNQTKRGALGRLGALTVLACCVSSGLYAQDHPVQKNRVQTKHVTELEDIVVTGTNIKGAEPVGNVVQVITPDEIASSGKASLADFLRDLPSNFAGGVATSSNLQGGQDGSPGGANLTGGQGLNLRGLGVLSTLVLINGRRVATSGQYGDYVDISNIPMAAVARIEILKDGASAVYGSDAVAGVVNVILKRGAKGFDTNLRFGTTTQGGGTETRLSQTWGNRWGTGNIFMGLEVNRQNRIAVKNRDMFHGGDFSSYGGVNWRRESFRVAPVANLFAGQPAGQGHVIYTVPPGSGVGLTMSDLTPVSDGVGHTHNPWENYDITPHMDRQSVFLSFDQGVGSSVMLHGDVNYTHRRGDYNEGYAGIYNVLPSTSPYAIDGLPNSFSVLVDDMGLKQRASVDSYFANFGANYMFGDSWTLGGDISWSQQKQARKLKVLRDSNVVERLGNGFAPSSLECALSGLNAANISALPGGGNPRQRFCASLDYEPFDPYSSEPLSSTVLSELIGYEDLHYNSMLWEANLKLDGTLFQMPGGPFKMAAGVDYRRERIAGDLDFNYRSINPANVPYAGTERKVASGYVEMAIPVVGNENALPFLKEWDFSVAGRYEHSTGLAGYSKFTPKVGFKLKPTDSWTIRGSWGTSFHAPPMRFMYNGPQPVQGGNAIFTRADFYTAPCSTTLIPLNGVNGTPGGSGNCTYTAMIVAGGAGPTLKPEKSHTWTFGVGFNPTSLPGLDLGVNYYNIHIDQRISRIQASQLSAIMTQYFATGSTPYIGNLRPNPSAGEAQGLMNDPRYLGQIGIGPHQTPDDVAMIVYATQTNLASLETDGVDFNASYRLEISGFGTLDLFANGTSIFSYKIKTTPGASWVNQLGEYTAAGNPVHLRAKGGLRWSRNGWQVSVAGNYTHGYECQSGCIIPNPVTGSPMVGAEAIQVGSWTTFDLHLGYALGNVDSIFRNTQFSLDITNLADRNPPFLDTGVPFGNYLPMPYDPSTGTIIGRTVAFNISKHW